MATDDLTSFLERVREDAGQESMTHAAADCADWRNSCSAHNAMRLAGMVEAALKLADEWSELPFADLEAGATADELRAAITAALAGKEAD